MIVVNAEHWLDENGEIPHDAPPGLFRNAMLMAQCIEYGGPLPRMHLRHTLIPCRRRPGGTLCRGTLSVVKTERDEIHAFCEACLADELLISNWQETLWADGPAEPLPVAREEAPSAVDLPPRVRDELGRALRQCRSPYDVDAVLRLIATAPSPGEVVQYIASTGSVANAASAQTLASALMAAWNHTPRAELDGETPEQRFKGPGPSPARRDAPKVGRNEPCPCGSGRKYKRCCGVVN
jgi:hypothetical protein